MPPLIHRDILPRDLDIKQDPTLAELNERLRTITQKLNILFGFHGPIPLANHINLNGNRIQNMGAAQSSTDGLSRTAADPLYSTAVQQSAMEAVGVKMLQTTRRLNDGTQQHTISSDLNTQGSIPPSNVTGTLHFAPTATTVVWTWTSIIIQLADLSLIGVQNGTLTVTGLVNATPYDFYPLFDANLGILSFIADSVNGVGAPPIAFTAANTAALQSQNGDGKIALTSASSGAQVTTGGAAGNATLRTRS